MRDCENCKNYKENEKGYKGCCKWDCKYESKDGVKNDNKAANR